MTREIAVGMASPHSGARDDFDWRISLAEVGRDAPFSAFPGVDRCIVLLHGGGMLLRARDGSFEHCLDVPLVPFRFAGELAVDAKLIDGPSNDFNLMTKRGRYRSEIDIHRGPALVEGGEIIMLMCIAGTWTAEFDGTEHDPQTLIPMQALLSRRPVQPFAVRPCASRDAALLQARLFHDRSP